MRKRRLGTRRIQSELLRLHDCSLSRATIHKVLARHDQKPLKASRRPRKTTHRYAREVPGERIQMATCKIAPKLYQYTAIDDCTRVRVLALYPAKTAANSLLFLEKVIEEMPFPERAHPNGSRQRVLRLQVSRADDGVCDQVPSDQAGLTAPER